MEESEYKSTYKDLASIRCVFEKTLTNNRAKCRLARHFCLADREGYSCVDSAASSKCDELLKILRKKSAFVLKMHDVSSPLPHNMEVRVQVGGITGLVKSLAISDEGCESLETVQDIHGVIERVTKNYGSLELLPYSEIVKSVVQFKGRVQRRRQR